MRDIADTCASRPSRTASSIVVRATPDNSCEFFEDLLFDSHESLSGDRSSFIIRLLYAIQSHLEPSCRRLRDRRQLRHPMPGTNCKAKIWPSIARCINQQLPLAYREKLLYTHLGNRYEQTERPRPRHP